MDGSETRTGAGRRKMSGMSEMGGKRNHGCFCRPSRNSIFFFFFFGVTWKAPRQRGMDARRTLRITHTIGHYPEHLSRLTLPISQTYSRRHHSSLKLTIAGAAPLSLSPSRRSRFLSHLSLSLSLFGLSVGKI
jgi:hypothetical protein